jgi:hypothetical protein
MPRSPLKLRKGGARIGSPFGPGIGAFDLCFGLLHLSDILIYQHGLCVLFHSVGSGRVSSMNADFHIHFGRSKEE